MKKGTMLTYRLSPHTKFRFENDHILICDCKRLLDYKLPLQWHSLLVALTAGVDIAELQTNDDIKTVIDDLVTAKLISDVDDNYPEHSVEADIWSRLFYKGPERS